MYIEDLEQNPLYQWLAANPNWIAVVILTIAFAESLAIIGVIVPGVALLAAAAFLAGSGLLSAEICLLMAFIGAILGDGCSFLLGRHYQDWLRRLSIFTQHREWVERGEQFFLRHGIISIVIGRFIGPIRPFMPMVAGMMAMRKQTFFLVNGLSALLWAPVYILPGFALGASFDLPFSHSQLLLGGFAALIALLGSFYALRQKFRF